MKYVIMESIICCILFSIIVIYSVRKNRTAMLHNLSPKIQKRVYSMPEYRNRKILTTKERIIKKLPALFIVLIIFGLLVYLDGAKTFYDGFIYSLVLWTIIKLYVVFIIDCLWYAHAKSYWIKGTEDMKSEYQNYKFYLKSIPRSIIAGTIISVIIGLIIMIINFK